MKHINLLDCTLRDGGYINNWEFGINSIRGIVNKLEQTGIEVIELGFLKGDVYDENKSIFPSTESFKNIIKEKRNNVMYVGMADLSNPLPIERYEKCDGSSIDGVRVIFKKEKINDAYEYCKKIKDLGYKLFVNFVSTNQYSDEEFKNGIEKFSKLNPTGISIVDTFGTIKRKTFIHLAEIANKYLPDNIMLCYHAHNNLQQAFGNAEALIDMNLSRDILIDACVFGMGRGAGNLSLELFADYLNEYCNKKYQIAPMLEIMDKYLDGFYKTKFWGYSLPLYLSASLGCHPNYAIYLAEKNTLPVKAFDELLRSISDVDKIQFSKEKAEMYYKKYMENYLDDKVTIDYLTTVFKNKKVLLLAPGKSIKENYNLICNEIKKCDITLAVNFYEIGFNIDYVFSSNMKHHELIDDHGNSKMIVTSNLDSLNGDEYIVNYSSYLSENNEILDNSGLMAIRLLISLGVLEINIAGMDGFSSDNENNYYIKNLISDHSKDAGLRNSLIKEEIDRLKNNIKIIFITKSLYSDK